MAEVKTEQLQLNSGGFVIKMVREFGFPTLVALGVSIAWWLTGNSNHREAMKANAELAAKVEVLSNRVKALKFTTTICAQQKGYHVPAEDDE